MSTKTSRSGATLEFVVRVRNPRGDLDVSFDGTRITLDKDSIKNGFHDGVLREDTEAYRKIRDLFDFDGYFIGVTESGHGDDVDPTYQFGLYLKDKDPEGFNADVTFTAPHFK